MLELFIPNFELFDNESNEFITVQDTIVRMEHSLLAISKWEAIWQKPYLDDKPKTQEEELSYLICMCLDPVDVNVVRYMPMTCKDTITKYLKEKHTATWFSEKEKHAPSREVITSELIYYWMIEAGIPFECETWNINRLLTLVRVCGSKMSKGKKMSNRDIMRQNSMLNAQRRARMGSKG